MDQDSLVVEQFTDMSRLSPLCPHSTRWMSGARLARKCRAYRQQPRDGNVQGFREDQDFEITDTAEADFDFGNTGSVDVRSQVYNPICQLLLGEPGARPQPRLADTRADDVF